jgi:[ribosomal protein S18]-alanine N-acetyltransferase
LSLLTLKPFAVEHLSAAVQLDQVCLGGLWSLDGYRRELDSPNSLLLALLTPNIAQAAEPNNTKPNNTKPNNAELQNIIHETLLGMICAWKVLDEVHITLLAVHPDVQRQGFGELLLLGLLRLAQQQGLERATLEVRPSNQAALGLYQKFEFQVAGRRRQYYPDREDGLILWRSGLQDSSFATALEHLTTQLKQRLATAGWTVKHDLGEHALESEIRTNTRPENF